MSHEIQRDGSSYTRKDDGNLRCILFGLIEFLGRPFVHQNVGMLCQASGLTGRGISLQGPCSKMKLYYDEVSIYDLIDQTGARMIPSLFGSTWKKDVVVVLTLFGILARALKKNNQNENKVLSSIEFKVLKDMINGLPIEEMARTKEFPANVPDTPPSTPEESKQPDNVSPCSAETKTPFETLENLESVSMGPRLKMRQSRAVAKRCVDEVQDQFTSSRSLLGKAFGYGFLYCDQGRQEYSTAQIQASALTRSTEIRKRVCLYQTCFKNAFFVQLISMYELAYCSWCIVVSTASTKG